MTSSNNEPHLEEGDLVRLLDGQADYDERVRGERHLAACPACSRAYDELQRLSERLRRELARDVINPTPGRPPQVKVRTFGAGWWRVAAAIVMLLVATSVFRPVRAWVTSGWHSVVELFSSNGAATPATSVTPDDSPSGGAVISFTPRDARLVINLATWQSAGDLTILVDTGQDVTAQVVSDGPSEPLTIVPSGGINVGNTARSVSDYRITVPSSVGLVIVRIAGVTVDEFTPTIGQAPRVVGLKGR